MEFLTTLFNVLLIVLGFGLLIAVHELGHFIAAKWAGIRTEAFAIGMGPNIFSWRKGIGIRFGSTERSVMQRVREHMKSSGSNIDLESDQPAAVRHIHRAMEALNIGETEYSLRWLPVGGFVKMLGQEDANPTAVSDDPRSYTRCPVGKRMVVVSAGVIMNILLALVLFMVAFMAGVKFEAPIVGEVAASLPAGRTMADNAKELGIETPGLMPGDEVKFIDHKPATTFADMQIASAMSRPGKPVRFSVQRSGYDQLLEFSFQPELDPASGLRGIGILPGTSSALDSQDDDGYIRRLLKRTGLAEAGVAPGMRIVRVNGQPISTYGQIARAAHASNGQPLTVEWGTVNEQGDPTSALIETPLVTQPVYLTYRQKEAAGDEGLIGFSPLTRVVYVDEKSPNLGKLQSGDVILRVADVEYPRRSQIFETLSANKGQTVPVDVLRNGERVGMTCDVSRKGQLMIEIGTAQQTLISAQPITTYMRYSALDPTQIESTQTPIAPLEALTAGGVRILAVNDLPVDTWPAFREALRNAAGEDSASSASAATVRLDIARAQPETVAESVTVELSASDVSSLLALGWTTELPSSIFESIQTLRTAHGNPFTAIAMGFAETHKLVLMTYLTIDRLFRGTVGVDQLRGPVGIVHIGSKVADRGFMYVLFFLGMISVNLAVINFLPMPIVDGGLFLFLIYEKFKGRPPSLAFQNAATIVGLCLIVTLFVVTFYNDVMRLIS